MDAKKYYSLESKNDVADLYIFWGYHIMAVVRK